MTTNGGGDGSEGNNQNPAGGNNDGTNNSSNGGGNVSGGFAQALNQDNLGYAQKKGWKLDDPNTVVSSYRELERLNTTKLQEFNAPANPSDYKFKLPDGIPAEGFYDDKFAEKFKEWSHKGKLPVTMAQAVHDEFVKHSYSVITESQKAEEAALNGRIEKAHEDLTKAWGSQETPAFARNVEMSRRAMSNLDPDLKQALKETGVIVDQKDKDGKVQEVVTNATILKALAKAGSALFAEDQTYGSRPQGENPFDPKVARTPQAMTRQGELIRNDPELATTLIRAAGVEKDWGHFLNKRKSA
jgi:hypothetical protein